MQLEDFWSLIEESRSQAQSDTQAVEVLKTKLLGMAALDIRDFYRHQAMLMEGSYLWSLLGAAYIIMGGCNDDAFDAFRAWLIMQGKKVYEQAVRDPDSLADVVEGGDPALEEFLFVALDAFESVTNQELSSDLITYPDLEPNFDLENREEMEKLYPRLFKKFGE